MATVVGGLRARLIRDSLERLVEEGLTDRGWLSAGRRHEPIVIVPAPDEGSDPVQINSLAVSMPDVGDDEAEMGSNLTEDRWTAYVDFYAEDEKLGAHVAHEIRDYLRGKMPSVGRTRPILPVFDFRLATPAEIFVCEIESVTVDRATGFTSPFKKFWYSVALEVVDTYCDETDGD